MDSQATKQRQTVGQESLRLMRCPWPKPPPVHPVLISQASQLGTRVGILGFGALGLKVCCGASALGLRGLKGFRASRICGFSVSEVLRLEVFRAIGV